MPTISKRNATHRIDISGTYVKHLGGEVPQEGGFHLFTLLHYGLNVD